MEGSRNIECRKEPICGKNYHHDNTPARSAIYFQQYLAKN